MQNMFKTVFKGRLTDAKSWGLERATPELLGEADKNWIELRYKVILDYLEKPNVVLDAACGTGFGSAILSTRVRVVYGIDISKEAIRYAKIKYQKNNTVFSCGNVEKIQYKNGYFDAAIGVETIEHLYHPGLYLNELKRVVKSNGKIFVTTPQKISNKAQTPFHIHEYTYKEFVGLLQNYFEVIETIGLKRETKPIFDIVTKQNYQQFDIYLSICSNIK